MTDESRSGEVGNWGVGKWGEGWIMMLHPSLPFPPRHGIITALTEEEPHGSTLIADQALSRDTAASQQNATIAKVKGQRQFGPGDGSVIVWACAD